MQLEMLDVLRCPFCGGRLALSKAWAALREGDEVQEGLLQCACCAFPVVGGIPILRLGPSTDAATAHLQEGRPDLAVLAMCDLPPDRAARFAAIAASSGATYREAVEALGLNLEGGYFLYRFSDPSYRVAHALVEAVAGNVLAAGGRAIDLCGGSGHLTRSLTARSSPVPVLADLFFSKLWLARRFTAPDCEAVCCDANGPLPFRRGAFRFAMCADAFMFIWTKRLFVQEMARLVDDGSGGGTAVISHAHNLLQWSPSHGQPLSPDGYRDLFETIPCRVFGETGLFEDIVHRGAIDLSRQDAEPVLAADPALVIVATRLEGLFRRHEVGPVVSARGEFRINPLYVVEGHGQDERRVRLRLQFPSTHYEDEFGACRAYLPDEVVIDRDDLAALGTRLLPPALGELAQRRVVLDLPKKYY